MNIKQYIKQNKPLYMRKGMFTTAYIYTESVLIDTCDPFKEGIAIGLFPDSIHVPKVDFIDIASCKPDNMVYIMPRYIQGPLKQLLIPSDYNNIYKPLRELYLTQTIHYNPHKWHKDFINNIQASRLAPDMQELLIDMFEACMNYTLKVRFEISPRNVAVRDSRLVLLDCFYTTNK